MSEAERIIADLSPSEVVLFVRLGGRVTESALRSARRQLSERKAERDAGAAKAEVEREALAVAARSKVCLGCRRRKSADEFYGNRRGLSSRCRICHKKQSSECGRRRRRALAKAA